MTTEEITKLAVEYVEELYPREDFEDIGQMDFLRDMSRKNAASFMRWLLRTHCIVSKEKVAEIKENRDLKEYEFLTERCIEDLIPERMDWHDILSLCDGMYYALNQLLDETDK